jgi:NAD(P)-dependent dehydrogenase (short-subunit alcohol dehydrogenase family)
MSQDFAGKTALITGSTSGIGRQVATQLAARGAHVIITGRDKARGEQTVATITSNGGRADFVEVELGDIASVRSLSQRALDIGGGHVDILVNNAGLFPFAPTANVPVEEFGAVMDVNVRAPFYLVADLAPKMAEHGDGAIVNTTTMVANFGAAGMSLYGASKAALQLLTKSWAAEFGGHGVRVNAVSPGPTLTEGTSGMAEVLKTMAALAPANRVGTPEEVANAIVFLASPAASMIHGAVLPVDGGRLAA